MDEQVRMAPGPQRTSGLAIVSMILSILGLLCFLPVIGSLIGAILGHVALGKCKRENMGGGGMALAGVIMGWVGLALNLIGLALLIVPLLLAGTLPALSQGREKARRINDAGNLKQIGLACLMYSGDNGGQFPPDLAALIDADYIGAGKVFIAPGSGTAQPATAADVRAGQCDYVYLGAGQRDDQGNPTGTPIAYTREGCLSKWVNVLFADGHVEGLAAPDGFQALASQKGWNLQQAP